MEPGLGTKQKAHSLGKHTLHEFPVPRVLDPGLDTKETKEMPKGI